MRENLILLSVVKILKFANLVKNLVKSCKSCKSSRNLVNSLMRKIRNQVLMFRLHVCHAERVDGCMNFKSFSEICLVRPMIDPGKPFSQFDSD